ncbi:hypothetical protein Btru_033493 [Bulinus truncatus]|nr:hypothetical protein Btru_033493 [Bulinus truncatus]
MSYTKDDTTAPTGTMDTPRKPESSLLTDCQISDILKVLEDTRRVLDKYIVIFEDDPVTDSKVKLSSWWGRHCWPHRRRTLYRYIAVVTAGLQFVSLLTVSILDSWPKHHDLEEQIYIASSCSMAVIQFVNVSILTLATGHVIKMMYRQTLNFWTLSQTYLATTLMFAGILTTSSYIQVSPHVKTVSPHVKTVSPHVKTVSPHVKTVSQHVKTVSQHVKTVSQHVKTVSQHVMTVSQHVKRSRRTSRRSRRTSRRSRRTSRRSRSTSRRSRSTSRRSRSTSRRSRSTSRRSRSTSRRSRSTLRRSRSTSSYDSLLIYEF